MGTKMKSLLKGLRYISHVFDEEKNQEMQIGLPTDVKHVAHIGWDGPSASIDSPSWMKEYAGPGAVQSAPLDAAGHPIENPRLKWVSEDTPSRRFISSPAIDLPELPKSTRRHSTDNSLTSDSLKKDSTTKSRSARRSKDSEGNRSSSRPTQDPNNGEFPDIPKKSRRKKSKESSAGEGSTRSSRSRDPEGSPRSSRSKDPEGSTRSSRSKEGSTRSLRSKANIPPPTDITSPFSDPGADVGSISGSSTLTFQEEKEKGNSEVS